MPVRPGESHVGQAKTRCIQPAERKGQLIFVGGPDCEAWRLRRDRKSDSTVPVNEPGSTRFEEKTPSIVTSSSLTLPIFQHDFAQSSHGRSGPWTVHDKRSPQLATATRGRGRCHARVGTDRSRPPNSAGQAQDPSPPGRKDTAREHETFMAGLLLVGSPQDITHSSSRSARSALQIAAGASGGSTRHYGQPRLSDRGAAGPC